ncbi:uncharacterized protein [Nicotiana sylvestris]|uniref:uncharacterized protein n=1 Tax=Nicotiana sylvestris TaxID=4096 RepID=UPI00388C40A1
MEYLTIKDLVILWNNLKDTYDYLKMAVLPQERYGWTHLRLQDFKSIMNETNFHQANRGRGRGPSRGHGRGQRRNFNHGNNNAPKNPPYHQQWKRKEQKHEAVQAPNVENACYRCGGKEHLSRTYRMSKHLVELYQAFLKKTKKNAEANFISEDNLDFIYLDVADYFALPAGETSHAIGCEYVEM